MLSDKRIDLFFYLRFLFHRIDRIYAFTGGLCCRKCILKVNNILCGRYHHPEVREDSKHKPYREIRVCHSQNTHCPENFIPAQKHQVRILHSSITFIPVCNGMFFKFFGFLFTLFEKILFFVCRTYLMKEFQSFRQSRLKHFHCPVLLFFKSTDITCKFSRKKHHDGIGHQDEHSKLPMYPKQYHC